MKLLNCANKSKPSAELVIQRESLVNILATIFFSKCTYTHVVDCGDLPFSTSCYDLFLYQGDLFEAITQGGAERAQVGHHFIYPVRG